MRLREKRSEIEAAGGSLAAISIDPPADLVALEKRLAEDGGPLGFPLLSDPSGAATKAFGVWDAEHEIALPSILILDAQGRVAWKYVAEGVLDRPEEDDVVAAVKAAEALRAGAGASAGTGTGKGP